MPFAAFQFVFSFNHPDVAIPRTCATNCAARHREVGDTHEPEFIHAKIDYFFGHNHHRHHGSILVTTSVIQSGDSFLPPQSLLREDHKQQLVGCSPQRVDVCLCRQA